MYACCLGAFVTGVALLWSDWYAVSTGEAAIHEKGKPAIVAYVAGPHARNSSRRCA
jgi:hypothetical protein